MNHEEENVWETAAFLSAGGAPVYRGCALPRRRRRLHSEKSGAVNWVETVDEGILQEPVEIPILMYHNLVAEEDDPSISKNTMWVGQFQHQMELLEENGFTTITVDQLVEFGNRGKALAGKAGAHHL